MNQVNRLCLPTRGEEGQTVVGTDPISIGFVGMTVFICMVTELCRGFLQVYVTGASLKSVQCPTQPEKYQISADTFLRV